jgi:hypothetical protein
MSDALDALREADDVFPHAANVLDVLRVLAQRSRLTKVQRQRAKRVVAELHRHLTSAAIALDGLPTPTNPTGNQ